MSNLRQALIKSGAIRPNKLRRTKAKRSKVRLIPYCKLKDLWEFRRFGHTYTKVCDAYSLNTQGKDSIFYPHELVEPVKPITCCLPRQAV